MSYKKIILIFCLGIFLSAERNANAQTKTLNFSFVSDTFQIWTVPTCVDAVTIQMWAGGGGGGNWNSYSGYEFAGGSGAYYEGVIKGVAPGTALHLYVPSGGLYSNNSAGGAGGWPGGAQGGNDVTYGEEGGGGGGYAVVKINGTVYMVCGAGGGGGSWPGESCYGGSGGAQTGGNAGPSAGTAAQGGTISAGGAAGSSANACDPGSPGTAFYGGHGGGTSCSGYYGGGGGGGGYYGGGGGGDYAGGGGGGSSFPATSYTSGGITSTMLLNTQGNAGTNAAVYAAPGNPPAGIGQGGYIGNNGGAGGNGYIIVTYTTDSVGSAQGNVISNIICSGNATGVASALVNHVAGAGAFTYTWIPNVSNRDTATGLLAGTYTILVTGCGSASTTVTITQPAFFVSNPTINEIQCNGGKGSIIAGAIGGTTPYTFVFTPGGNVPSINNLSVGTYSLNVLDNRGCASSSLISITQPNLLSVTAHSIDSVICNGQNNGSATSAVSGGTYPYTYLWSPNGGNGASASGLTAGTYQVNITDNNGCKSSTTVAIVQPYPLSVLVYPALLNLACNGDNNGVLGSGVEGGTRPYSYRWSNNLGTDSNATGLAAGTYTLTVTDAHHCVTTVTSTVTQPSPIVVAIDSTFNHGYCSGTAWVTLNGGVLPYTYLWSNGSKTYYQNGLCDGLYCCTVTDANGCVQDICTHITSDLGVDNLSGSDAKITVYPNPNNGLFTIQSTEEGQSTVEVYNVLGAKVYSGMLNAGKGSDNTINMSNQPNGVYLYRVMSSINGSLVGEGKVVLEK